MRKAQPAMRVYQAYSSIPLKRKHARTQGMTLIEIIAVLVVIGLAAGGLGLSISALNRTDLKSSCNRIIAAARYAYNRATIYGTTVRIAFDIPGGQISLEESNGRIVLARPDDERLTEAEEVDENRGLDVDPWEAAKARLGESLKPNLGASSFGPVAGASRFTKVALGRGVTVTRLIVAHEPEPLESGHGAIYFFPGGFTEHAVIHLSQGSDTVYAVEIHPLTGRGKVYDYAYEPVSLLGNPEEKQGVSEVEMR